MKINPSVRRTREAIPNPQASLLNAQKHKINLHNAVEQNRRTRVFQISISCFRNKI